MPTKTVNINRPDARNLNNRPLSLVPKPQHRAGLGSARTSPHGLRVAAIDIGTNSLHMVIVEVTDQLSFRVLGSEKELTQLGSAALVHHKLTRRAMAHTLEVLGRYQRIARGLDCDVIRAYATSAVRESVNGGDFVEAARNQLGLRIQVITPEEEARLIYLAVRHAVDLSPGPVLIVDIGGGSAEFIVGNNDKALLLESRKLGASRLTQQFVHSDPISRGDSKDLAKHIRKQTKDIFNDIRDLKPTHVIGTSGTMENLVRMCLFQHGEESARHRLLTDMSRDDFESLFKRLHRSSVDERRDMPGLDPGRADQILAGAMVVKHVFDELDCDRIEVCDRALREGMIIHYMQTHWPKVRLSVQVRDPRRRSILDLGRRCNFNEKHAHQVASLALSLFDQLRDEHELGPRERELLEFAALAHDVGWHIGHNAHHKHSYYLIKNGDLEGFSPNEIDIIANVARYHRKSPPKKSHDGFVTLDTASQRAVWVLGGILRIADGLDRSHFNNVLKARALVRKRTVSLTILTKSDPELDEWGARRKADMLEQALRIKLKISARQLTRKEARAFLVAKPSH